MHISVVSMIEFAMGHDSIRGPGQATPHNSEI